jgi:hypothetical protein
MRILALAILTIGDGLNRAGGGPDVRSGLSDLPARVRPGYLLRLPLRVAASVRRVSVGPRGTVRHQSIFRERGRAPGFSAASPPLLKLCPHARKPPSLTGPETSAEMCSRCASAKGPFKILSADMRWKGWSTPLGTSPIGGRTRSHSNCYDPIGNLTEICSHERPGREHQREQTYHRDQTNVIRASPAAYRRFFISVHILTP